MRVIAALLLLILALPARAAEVVWLDPPPDEAAITRVATAAGAAGPPLAPIDLRAAATAWGPEDTAALAAVEDTLRDVRMYETRLDGELLIMRGLERPIGEVTALRGQAHRDLLFAALAYQGFAVDRFFADELATDERAEPYRATLEGVAIERPWLDAIAIAPEREVTAYEIAEAPQRIAFGEVREVVLDALPAEIHVEGLPEGAEVIVDGLPSEPRATGGHRVPPGRHLVGAVVDDHLIARWDVRLESAGAIDLAPPLPAATWQGFLDALRAGESPPMPAGLAPCLEALGGEVWIARASERGEVQVARLASSGLEPVELPPVDVRDGAPSGLSVGVALSAGWLYSADFYLQDPLGAPHEVSTVNSLATGLSLDGAWDRGLLRLSGGMHALYTPGEHHLAAYGGNVTRVRPQLWLGAGIRYAQITAGWLFPHHPTLGARATIPVASGLEVQGYGLYGPGLDRTRSDGTVYEGGPLWAAGLGIGWRFAP